jgi:hypothetical protein
MTLLSITIEASSPEREDSEEKSAQRKCSQKWSVCEAHLKSHSRWIGIDMERRKAAILASQGQPLKQSPPIPRMDGGRLIEFSRTHPANARTCTIESRLSEANVTLASDLQPSKQFLEMTSSDEGIQIESNDEHLENADLLRNRTPLPDSNVRTERFLQSWKQKA